MALKIPSSLLNENYVAHAILTQHLKTELRGVQANSIARLPDDKESLHLK
jgi:hypothetical protein